MIFSGNCGIFPGSERRQPRPTPDRRSFLRKRTMAKTKHTSRREIWKTVPAYGEKYEASNLGRIRSWRGKIRALRIGGGGYLALSLRPPGTRRPRLEMVHRLVLMAFRGLPQPGEESRHLNGVRADARLANLKWGTRKENCADRKVHGTSNAGERNGRSRANRRKMTPARIVAIRRLRHRHNMTYDAIARRFRLSPACISCICRGLSWRNVPMEKTR